MPAEEHPCPDCGTPLDVDALPGLCPRCLLELALESPSLRLEIENAAEAPTEAMIDGMFSPGQILGGRYRVRSLLGRGGMGEVWRAFDLKLRVDVALKALRRSLLANERALETLRQEVRTAREVVSSNVCRVYDLIELDGQELVSMEYVDGVTLLDILRARAPLELTETREIASQFLSGLEAIHAAGLVHRDVKPENLMMTRAGRVVVMDFGIAKGLAEAASGTIAGTPAYMAPEQARGEVVTPRADVYSAAVVLVEMIAPEGLATAEARQEIWQAIREQPPCLPESPWEAVLRRALDPTAESRHESAAVLARALEEVTLRVEGEEGISPYPGLTAFTLEDAEYFFGRELEVEEMWKRLQRPHLLGLIGPSGAGKSSFLQAGLMRVVPTGWRVVLTAPGMQPFTALGQALVPELAGDTEAMKELLRFEEPEVAVSLAARWRKRHDNVLLIVDQFEELFTQNPPDVQDRFAELLGRLAVEADVRVLLSMRDDFLFHCSSQPALAPMFSELTPLRPPSGSALRRALVQPALKCGYRFEDDALVDEMLAEVGDERGALPMLAFAAARLWELRDREQGLLTRSAYEQIGGVARALAHHAERTLERIGNDRVPMVRELFRNLVTSQGTRIARDREDLLSVFEPEARRSQPAAPGPHPEAAAVLDALIDARLLTSFEVSAAGEDDEPSHHIEIVHESLLSRWPRLVRWQTQDTEGAQLRDELRQAAQMWDQHDRSDDLLWTGTAFREFRLWHERYPGGLSGQEEAFAAAMTRHAEKRRRRRRLAFAAVLATALSVAAGMGALWVRSEAQARRAEAAKLLAFSHLRLDEDPTEALAYATASLRLVDTEETRVAILKALAVGPPARVLEAAGIGGERHVVPRFSPNGEWLSWAGVEGPTVLVWRQDGSGPVVLDGHASSAYYPIRTAWISPKELVTGHPTDGRARIWSFPGGELRREIEFGSLAFWGAGAGHLVAELVPPGVTDDEGRYLLRSWQLPDGQAEDHGEADLMALGASWSIVDPNGPGWIYAKGTELFYRSFAVRRGATDRLIGRHENRVGGLRQMRQPGRLWTRDAVTGELRLWNLTGARSEPLRILKRPEGLEEGINVEPAPGGRWLYDDRWTRDGKALLWDLSSLPGADPHELKRSGKWFGWLEVHPEGDWAAVPMDFNRLSFWPLSVPMPTVVSGYDTGYSREVAFSPDGRWLVSYWGQDKLRLWPLPDAGGDELLELGLPAGNKTRLAMDATGSRFLAGGYARNLEIVSLEETEARPLSGFQGSTLVNQGAFSPSGRRVAAATLSSPFERVLRVWDLETGDVETFDLPQPGSRSSVEGETSSTGDYWVWQLAFTDEATLLTAGNMGVLQWNLAAGTHRTLVAPESGRYPWFQLSADRGRVVSWVEGDCDSLTLHELATGESQRLEPFADCRDLEFSYAVAFDDTLSVLAIGSVDGTIEVGRLGGGPAHLLIGHRGPVSGLAIAANGHWLASSGEDETLRLWPMPDLDRPPLQTLPHEELLAKLESLTNIRVVRDPKSPDGWKVTLDPFPGWKNPPSW